MRHKFFLSIIMATVCSIGFAVSKSANAPNAGVITGKGGDDDKTGTAGILTGNGGNGQRGGLLTGNGGSGGDGGTTEAVIGFHPDAGQASKH